MDFEYDAQSSPTEIIMTFNDFISTIPRNKSFDMTYKAYLQDVADFEERTNLSRLSSCTQLRRTSSTCLSSFGYLKHIPSNTSMLNRTHLSLKTGPISSAIRSKTPSRLSTRPSRSSSRISLHSSSSRSISSSKSESELDEESVGQVTLRQMDEIYKDNLTRKRRSMVNLSELNKALGLPHIDPPPSMKTPDTIYENLSTLNSFASPAPSTFNYTHDEFARVIPSTPRTKNVELFIKISECFD